MRIDLEDVEREVVRGTRWPRSTDASHCCDVLPGSHIIRSRLTLSNPAARAISTASLRPRDEWSRPSRCKFVIAERLHAEAQAIDAGVRETLEASRVDRLRVGLERDLARRGQAERRRGSRR